MKTSKNLKQKLLKNKIKFNNLLLSNKKNTEQKLGFISLKQNKNNINQPLLENYFAKNDIEDDFNGIKYNRNIFNLNIMNNSHRSYINSFNNDLHQIRKTDERLIYCIKMLGLSKYYSNLSQKNLNFEEFLALTNKDMTLMKIPKNIQITIQKFIMDYFNFGNLYTLDEIKNFFRKKKLKNYFNIYKNHSKLNQKKYNKSLSQGIRKNQNNIQYSNINDIDDELENEININEQNIIKYRQKNYKNNRIHSHPNKNNLANESAYFNINNNFNDDNKDRKSVV